MAVLQTFFDGFCCNELKISYANAHFLPWHAGFPQLLIFMDGPTSKL